VSKRKAFVARRLPQKGFLKISLKAIRMQAVLALSKLETEYG